MENINIEPYKVNARYYQIFVESDGTTRKITTSDIEGLEISGNYIVLPEGFHVMSLVIDFNSVPATTITSRAIDIQFRTDGKQALFLPNADNFDYGKIYVLGHF